MSVTKTGSQGTESQEAWLERDAKSVGGSPYRPPLVLERGSGCELWDIEGKRYLDFEAGQFCMSTGHSHPRVAEAMHKQIDQLMQIGNRFTTRTRVELAERLARISGLEAARSFFCSTGSEANETALRIAKLVTGRYEIVALARGYHGRTGTAFGLSSSARGMRRGYGPPPPGLAYAPSPYAFRCPHNCGSCDATCWRHSSEMLEQTMGGEPAALIFEPVLGSGGIIPVTCEWAQAVRGWCDERGALLIADEALTGIGRTGAWFAFERLGITPDIVVTSKALGGGVPTAAIIATGAIADAAIARGFIQAASHQGDPFQCATAIANIDVIEDEGLLANATAMGARLRAGLDEIVAQHLSAGDSRGVGLIQGLEIVDHDGDEAPALAGAISLRCMERGLIIGGIRPGVREGNVLRLAPPLSVSPAQVDEALHTLDEALTVAAQPRS
jgi:2,2-dialkylglycine decarboxylase (pyruvate)